jgi:hypothetical protein
MVADILVYRKRGESLPTEILSQIEGLHPKVREKLEQKGLFKSMTSPTLAKYLEMFYESKSHLKVTTQEAYKQFGNLLSEFFGKTKGIVSIKESDCERLKCISLSIMPLQRYLVEFVVAGRFSS